MWNEQTWPRDDQYIHRKVWWTNRHYQMFTQSSVLEWYASISADSIVCYEVYGHGIHTYWCTMNAHFTNQLTIVPLSSVFMMWLHLMFMTWILILL